MTPAKSCTPPTGFNGGSVPPLPALPPLPTWGAVSEDVSVEVSRTSKNLSCVPKASSRMASTPLRYQHRCDINTVAINAFRFLCQPKHHSRRLATIRQLLDKKPKRMVFHVFAIWPLGVFAKERTPIDGAMAFQQRSKTQRFIRRRPGAERPTKKRYLSGGYSSPRRKAAKTQKGKQHEFPCKE